MRALRTLLLTTFLLAIGASHAQTFTISGHVKDASNGEALIGANVYVKETLKGTATNVYGYYVLNVPPGEHTLVMSFLGYEDFERKVDLSADLVIDIEAVPKAIMGKEVEVIGERNDENTESTEMGRVEIDVQKLTTLPALLGEVDILKTIQFLPGVQNNGEGNSGFYVRGGGPDQNLILLDDATVYNASPLFGFFSVFNADAVRNIELIKGGMPANYGGRISSVLDITMKEGNSKGFHGQGGIGLISSRLTLEGPIVKDRGSFIVSGRRTYIDVLVKPFLNDTAQISGSGYYFYDLNAKANYRLGEKDRVFLSGYFGRDVFTFTGRERGDQPVQTAFGEFRVVVRRHIVEHVLVAEIDQDIGDRIRERTASGNCEPMLLAVVASDLDELGLRQAPGAQKDRTGDLDRFIAGEPADRIERCVVDDGEAAGEFGPRLDFDLTDETNDHIVEQLDLGVVQPRSGARKEIRELPQGLGAFRTRPAGDRVFQVGDQRNAIRHENVRPTDPQLRGAGRN